MIGLLECVNNRQFISIKWLSFMCPEYKIKTKGNKILSLDIDENSVRV